MKDGLPGTTTFSKKFHCTHCLDGDCAACVDIIRARAGLGRICECAKHKTSSSKQASAAPSV